MRIRHCWIVCQNRREAEHEYDEYVLDFGKRVIYRNKLTLTLDLGDAVIRWVTPLMMRAVDGQRVDQIVSHIDMDATPRSRELMAVLSRLEAKAKQW